MCRQCRNMEATIQKWGNSLALRIPSGLAKEMAVGGAALSEHLRTLGWRSRDAELICRLPDPVIEEIPAKVSALICQRV